MDFDFLVHSNVTLDWINIYVFVFYLRGYLEEL
jgi:hypothetical protein